MGKIKEDSLGHRMKQYEGIPKNYLMLGCPKAIRLDMRAGHTFCRKFKRPFDDIFSTCMLAAAKKLCEDIPGVVMAYTQSDEISLVINDVTKNGQTNCFFDGNVEKIVSISASICSVEFNRKYNELLENMPESEMKEIYEEQLWKACFDSRVWTLPNIMEVHNYILWRQQDATRNSIQMVGHANFTDTELHKKNTSDIQDMLMLQKGINWNNFPVKYKRGAIILKEQYEKEVSLPNGTVVPHVKRTRWTEAEIPILTQDLDYIPKIFNRYLLVNGELEKIEKA